MPEPIIDIDLGDEHLSLTGSNPLGNGDPDCPKCKGRGALRNTTQAGTVPSIQRCTCVLVKQVIANLERGWVGLSQASPLPSPSPLRGLERKDLWITAHEMHFRMHLKHIAARKGPDWNFRVISDKDLITAWLATIPLNGGTLFDPDAVTVSMQYATIEDLAEPPTLLVIWLGVKAAANREMPQVLLEALLHRRHRGKPTWIVDQPTSPLEIGHRCWSDAVVAQMSGMQHIWLSQEMPSAITNLSAAQTRLPVSVLSNPQSVGTVQLPQVTTTMPQPSAILRQAPVTQITGRVGIEPDSLDEMLLRKGKKKKGPFTR